MQKKINLLILPSVINVSEMVEGMAYPVNFTKGRYAKLQFRFKNNQVTLLHKGKDLKEFSHIWLSSFWGSRDLAYATELYLAHHKIPHTFVEQTTSKISDQMVFTIGGLPTPNTFYIDQHDIIDYVSVIEDICGYPLIIKDTRGSKGRFSAFISNRIDLLTTTESLPKYRKYFFQKFVPNDYDWGVLVANGKVVSAEKSYSQDGDFRNNVCNGAKEVFCKLDQIPTPITKMAIKACKLLKLDWARADIIVDKNTDEPYLLEVNRCPGTTSETTEITGARQFLNSHLQQLYD